MSESNGSGSALFAALLEVQRTVGTLPKDATNPHFRSKYTPLDTIVERVGPVLAANGLVWTALPGADERGEPCLDYRLVHAASREELVGRMPLLLGKRDAQGFGSALTYARRYSMCAVLNLVADDDDDAHSASRGATPARAGQNAGVPPAPKPALPLDGVVVDRLISFCQDVVTSGAWTKQQLGTALRAAGATDTSSVGAAVRSLSVRSADQLAGAIADTLADHEPAGGAVA